MSEVETKRARLECAAQKFIVTDSSKSGARHQHTFARFDEPLSIVTNKRGQEVIVEEYEHLLKTTNTKIALA